MTVAALYDIHGNLPALDMVLQEIEQVGVDRIVIGGDVAFGPLVPEPLDRLLALGDRCLWLRGNADRELVSFFDGTTQDPSLPDDVVRAGQWEAGRITQAYRDFLAALPTRQVLNITGLGDVLFCHGSPHSDEGIITPLTSDARLSRLLSGVSQRTVVCGHTHMQFDRRASDQRVVNTGSVGMPYGEPGADWALLGPTIEMRHTRYDIGQASAAFLASGHPLAEAFAQDLARPTPAVEATAFFERVARHKGDAGPSKTDGSLQQ